MSKKLLLAVTVSVMLVGAVFVGFRYTNAINIKNDLEREKIQLEFKKLQQQREIETQKLEQDLLKEEARFEAQRQTAEREERMNSEKEKKYNNCITQADAQYDRSWNSACKYLSIRNEVENADCYKRCSNPTASFSCADGGDPEHFCRENYPSVEPTNCRALPSSRANPIIKSRDKAKEVCLQRYK